MPHTLRLFRNLRVPILRAPTQRAFWCVSYKFTDGFGHTKNSARENDSSGTFPFDDILPKFIQHLQEKSPLPDQPQGITKVTGTSKTLYLSRALAEDKDPLSPRIITQGLAERNLLDYYLRQTARYCNTGYQEERKKLKHFPALLALQAYSEGITCIDISQLPYELEDKANFDVNSFNETMRLLLGTNPGIIRIIQSDDLNSYLFSVHPKWLQSNQLAASSLEVHQNTPNIRKAIYDYLGLNLVSKPSSLEQLPGPNRLLLEAAAEKPESREPANMVTLLLTIAKAVLTDVEQNTADQNLTTISWWGDPNKKENRERRARYLIKYFETREYLAIEVSAARNRDLTDASLNHLLGMFDTPEAYVGVKKALRETRVTHAELFKQAALQVAPMTEKEKKDAIELMKGRLLDGVWMEGGHTYDEEDRRNIKIKKGELFEFIVDFFDLIPTKTANIEEEESAHLVLSPKESGSITPF